MGKIIIELNGNEKGDKMEGCWGKVKWRKKRGREDSEKGRDRDTGVGRREERWGEKSRKREVRRRGD